MNDVILTPESEKPLGFTLGVLAAAGAFAGIFVGAANGSSPLGIVAGAIVMAGIAFVLVRLLGERHEKPARWGVIVLFAIVGFLLGGKPGLVMGALFGWFFGWFTYWIGFGRYRRALVPYLTSGQVLWHYTFRVICGAIFVFLITPILVVMPLSFNAENFFTFTPEMLSFDPAGYSLKHYRDFLTNSEWTSAVRNSLMIAPVATVISVSLGTLAAIGLSQSHVPGKRAIMAILISPMIVPLIISATGMYFFYSKIGIVGTYWGVVLAHAVLGIPFVIITVTATLVGFDRSLTRAAANMGADPVTTFFRVQMPLILPGVISGGLFAFITSFDEVVVVLFIGSAELQTLPWQMFTGLREQISPTILAAATILVGISIMLLATVELLRRRSERLRGLSPS
ncbi:polyamine ABC transporter permease [Salipiger aestuarii]|uniref:Putative spermidine/putrescine transport system permease protein n=1 Tax=Salipiger aestuarii TaxID=568098 RepID=A0A327YV85_9RHOB|nr:ABC transporter permease [Salipiger aestuarii]EIE48836.1 binding-protein-dependent transport systems inner membrane component [Citreicella sp. 357]KAA8610404.1 polyamine ABC transporter permease [Salipiger aestuarii]KAA8616419.1 polyamine ABC transporter permease [Salipiger aestuarii]KAB2543485.1 polyamine ABC transporter permease [Salipiger aestuarii]RAK21949.1 putative spermidine/putrescine transport system permease protein [Salipiger aestuarii]